MVPDEPELSATLAAALIEASPRLFIDRPTLIAYPSSPTGWVVALPGHPDDDDLREPR